MSSKYRSSDVNDQPDRKTVGIHRRSWGRVESVNRSFLGLLYPRRPSGCKFGGTPTSLSSPSDTSSVGFWLVEVFICESSLSTWTEESVLIRLDFRNPIEDPWSTINFVPEGQQYRNCPIVHMKYLSINTSSLTIFKSFRNVILSVESSRAFSGVINFATLLYSYDIVFTSLSLLV